MKDVPAKAFIEAFAKHLKKGNRIKIQDVSHPLSLRLDSALIARLSALFNAILIIITPVVGPVHQDQLRS